MLDLIRANLGKHRIVRSLAELNFQFTPVIAMDIETAGDDKLPGDSPHYPRHGIAGLSLGNLNGDSCYIVIDDSRIYNGVPIGEFAKFWNEVGKPQVKQVNLHYSKFDLSFLLARGLDFTGLRLVDTWMILNIKAEGIYGSLKLKDYARNVLKIDTSTEEVKDQYMEAAGTGDYGDVPVELMAPYACDDTRYTLMVPLTQAAWTDQDWFHHDLYMRNNFNLMRAEARGVRLDIPLLQGMLARAHAQMEDERKVIKHHLGSVAVEPDDEQAMLAYLHAKQMHSGPREQFGEVKFVFDETYLLAVNQPLTAAYRSFWLAKMFEREFSGTRGRMAPRIWGTAANNAGLHVGHLQSIFSTGGLVKVKEPDLGLAGLTNGIRRLFIPREGFSFAVIRAYDLPTLLLADYARDPELAQAVRSTVDVPLVLKLIADRMNKKLTPRNRLSLDSASIFYRKVIEGSGIELLQTRLRARGATYSRKDLYPLSDELEKQIADYKGFDTRVTGQLIAEGFMRDKVGRVIRVPENKRWRSRATLMASSNGAILNYYLDLFCALAQAAGAHLVLVHEKEFIFEVPQGDLTFVTAAKELAARQVFDVLPVWWIQLMDRWQNTVLDSHEYGVATL